MTLEQVYQQLFQRYGSQHWWPAETPFEVMVGAILTQNTAWSNVERAIDNLRASDCLTPERILSVPVSRLANWLQPSGYFNIKAKRLRNFCQWYVDAGQFDAVSRWDTDKLRHALLSVNGVGPETADDILLYAFDRPVFVIDAYTRRLFSRLGLLDHDEGYEHLRNHFEEQLPRKSSLFNEYHALIVLHAKEVCRKKPLCLKCYLGSICPSRSE
jgi:endonuclease III related protein